jgi:ribosomal-protein-alanine N-acetyltransferase
LHITVEPADVRNLDDLLRIERECFTGEAYTREQTLSLLKSPNAVGLLAKVNNEVAGFTIGVVEKSGTIKAGHIYTVDVAIRYRRKGIGLRLVKEMEDIFLKRRAAASHLEVRLDNQAARKLYRKQGYKEIESLNDYYSAGVHGLRLIKQLKPE